MGPFYLITYHPDGYKPTYLIVDGRTLGLVRNPQHPERPLRFRDYARCINTVERMNEKARALEDRSTLNENEVNTLAPESVLREIGGPT